MRKHPLLAACGLVALTGVALGDGGAISGALAASAGTAFEAAPFLIVTAAVGPRLGAFAGLAGCGCARSLLPGALGVPAIALCALAFGPFATLARVAAGLGIWTIARAARKRRAETGGDGRDSPPVDLFADLEALAASAFLASVAAALLAHVPAVVPPLLAFCAGLVLGVLAPCATAGVALAAAFLRSDPALAAGVLCTAGLARLPLRVAAAPGEPAARARLAGAALVAALAWLALRGPSGLVTPRLLLPIGFAAVALACILGRLRTRTRTNALVPLLMLGALVTLPRPPAYRAEATRLDEAFAGERLAFTGLAHVDANGRATLTRFAITCCRLDATPVSVRLARRVDGIDGRWVDASGLLVASRAGGLELRTERLREVPEPADPFLYR